MKDYYIHITVDNHDNIGLETFTNELCQNLSLPTPKEHTSTNYIDETYYLIIIECIEITICFGEDEKETFFIIINPALPFQCTSLKDKVKSRLGFYNKSSMDDLSKRITEYLTYKGMKFSVDCFYL